jgi:hypothetical protein
LWQDPYALYTTLFCGIDPERGIFVGADPVLHSPVTAPISIKFLESHVRRILRHGWFAWEYEPRIGPIQVLVGGTAENFLRLVRFEREALGEAPGHRHLLAENLAPNRPADEAPLPFRKTG